MATLFQKLRTLFRANCTSLPTGRLRRVTSPSTTTSSARPNELLETFKKTINPMIAQVATTRRRREALAEHAVRLDAAVDHFLTQNKRTEAMVTQKRLTSTLELIKTYDGSLERQIAAAEELRDVETKLEGRLAIARQEREELGFLLQLAQAKEVSTQAMRSLDSLMGQGDSDVARAAENIRRRLDHADAAWEVQASRLDNQLDDAMHSLEVEAELAARMERLGIE
jgi:phage shock protein A